MSECTSIYLYLVQESGTTTFAGVAFQSIVGLLLFGANNSENRGLRVVWVNNYSHCFVELLT